MKHSYENKEFQTKEELFSFIRENKDTLLTQKREQIKEADSMPYYNEPSQLKETADKSMFFVGKSG